MALRILVICFIVMMPLRGVTQSIVLSKEGRVEVKDHFLHYVDAKGGLTIEDIKQREIPFAKQRSLNYGFDNRVHWFTFTAINHSPVEEWLLEIAFPLLDSVDFFIETDSGWMQKTAGDLLPINVRDIRHPNVVFRFPFPRGTTKQIFLRVKSTSSVQVPAILWKPDVFHQEMLKVQLINGLFYGAMIVMIIYQLFLFFSIGDRLSLYYVFTLISMMHVVSFFQGYSFLLLYPSHPSYNYVLAVLTGPMFLLFSTWLTRAFLGTNERNPWIDRLLVVNTELDILVAVLMLMFPGKISYGYHHIALLFHCLLALLAAGRRFYNNFRPALFYLLSWASLLIATIVFSMSNLGIFAEYLNTNSTGLIVGCILQMLLIAFAIRNRWNILVRENQQAKELEVKRKQEENERLEREVMLRTEEINLKNEKLEEVNRIKDKLFSIVSHDIKGPLSSLYIALSLTKDGTVSQQEFQELVGTLETRFNQTSEFIDNLLQWATLQIRGESFEPRKIEVAALCVNTIALLEYELKNKSIRVENNLRDVMYAFADENMVKSVLRNLITNAIKFTRKGGLITVSGCEQNGFIRIAVADTGIGIPQKNREKIFSLDSVTTLGTGQEKGTGLGLLLCKEFVERNNGKIWFETEEGKGTTFTFTLPVIE